MKRTVFEDVGIAVEEDDGVMFIKALDGRYMPAPVINRFPLAMMKRSRNIATNETLCADCVEVVTDE
jgi:hypothetical protein